MSDIDQIIEEDKKEHPSCGYSQQFSKEVCFVVVVLYKV